MHMHIFQIYSKISKKNIFDLPMQMFESVLKGYKFTIFLILFSTKEERKASGQHVFSSTCREKCREQVNMLHI